MKNIIPTKTQLRSSQWVFLVLAGLACAVFLIAAPSLMARVVMLPGDAVRGALLANNAVPDTDLQKWAATRRRALHWRAMAEVLDDLALASLTQAGREKADSKEAKDQWRDAIQWQRRALARAPSDTFGWARLAYMITQTEGLTDEAAATLTHSFDTGPYEPALALIRLNMAVLMLDKLDPDVNTSLSFMIRAAWNDDPRGLVRSASENHFISLAEKALADDPEKLENFREKLSAMDENEKHQKD